MGELAIDQGLDLRNKNVEAQLEELFADMAQHTDRLVNGLRVTGARRRLADKVVRKVGRRRTWFGGRRHSPVQMRCVEMMIRLGIAAHPGNQKLALQIGRYYSDNYVWEWCRSAIFQPVRVIARDMILRGADSEFGETPQAAHLGYVLAHYKELGIENVSRYSELTTRNLALERENFFRDMAEEARTELGLEEYVDRAVKSLSE